VVNGKRSIGFWGGVLGIGTGNEVPGKRINDELKAKGMGLGVACWG